MSVQLSPHLQSNDELSRAVNAIQTLLESYLPRSADAIWDLTRDERNRDVLVLALSDPFGYAVGKFAPDELTSQEQMVRKLNDLVGELLTSTRCARIEIRDALCTTEQIAELQSRINAIPDIVRRRPRLFNQVQMSPSDPSHMLIREFAIEVDEDVADRVRQAVRESGFYLRDDPLLERRGMLDRVRELVDQHLHDGQAAPKYAFCINISNPDTLHLVEISEEAPYIGDGSLDGVAFAAGDALPGARSIVLYLTSPDELRLVAVRNPHHPVIRDIQGRRCIFVYPDATGDAFFREFPDLAERPRELARP